MPYASAGSRIEAQECALWHKRPGGRMCRVPSCVLQKFKCKRVRICMMQNGLSWSAGRPKAKVVLGFRVLWYLPTLHCVGPSSQTLCQPYPKARVQYLFWGSIQESPSSNPQKGTAWEPSDKPYKPSYPKMVTLSLSGRKRSGACVADGKDSGRSRPVCCCVLVPSLGFQENRGCLGSRARV